MPDSFSRRLGRRLQPLLQPTREDDQRVLKKLAAAVESQEQEIARQREQLTQLRQELAATGERLTGVRKEIAGGVAQQRELIANAAHEIEVVNRDNLRRLQGSVSRSGAFLKGVLRNAQHITNHAVVQQRVFDRLARIAASGRPIVVGPWLGEVGFELLYWVPFVRWFVEHHDVDPARLTVVSRGGPRSWYGALAPRYVDALEVVSPGALAEPTKTRKQRHVSARDRRMLRHAISRSVAARAHGPVSVLHPSYLYALCGPYFDGFMGTRTLLDVLRPQRIDPPARALAPELPARYVAAKFYFSASFPDTPANRTFVDALLARIAVDLPVVLLDTPQAVDDHQAYRSAKHQDMTSVGMDVTPANNLDAQTMVVGNAEAFIGTYGGFSYLAPLCGVPAYGIHAADEFYEHHRHLADLTYSRLHLPPLTVLPVAVAAGLTIGRRTAQPAS